MLRNRHKILFSKGFTIVELMVVVVVIGILATVTIVSYGAWRQTATINQMKSDLSTVASTMENYKTFNNAYQITAINNTTFTNFTPSPGDTLTGGSTDGINFCIDATNMQYTTLHWYIDNLGNTPTSGTCSARTNVPIPTLPSGIAVTTASDKSITLGWTSTSSYTVTYGLLCSLDPSFINGDVSANVAYPATSGTVNGLTSNTGYYCEFNATDGAGTSAWSSYVPTATLTSPPGGLATTSISASQINATWTAISGATYNLQYSTDSTFATGTTTLNLSSASGSGTSLTTGTVYYFRVEAISGGVTTAWSTTSSVATSPSTPVLTTVSTSQINATWTTIVGASSYNLQYSTDSTFATGVTTLNPTSGTASATSLNPGTIYYFRVRGITSGGTSGWSVVSNTVTIPAAPSNLVAYQTGYVNNINTSWTSVTGATSYEFQYSTTSSFTSTGSIIGSASSISNAVAMTAGQPAYFRVRAINSSGDSSFSAAAQVPSQLNAGQILTCGNGIRSPGGLYWAIIQCDGNFVVYNSSSTAQWNAGTSGAGNYWSMQTDGNMVIYNSANGALWQSTTSGCGTTDFIAIQDDSSFVIYHSGVAIWSRASGKFGC
jgi:prepilin-type N-terminal cleavage/methylation domain-containing protein